MSDPYRRACRYLGGDLNICSAEGYGTDAYVHVPGNAYDATEVLPAATKHELRCVSRSVKDW